MMGSLLYHGPHVTGSERSVKLPKLPRDLNPKNSAFDIHTLTTPLHHPSGFLRAFPQSVTQERVSVTKGAHQRGAGWRGEWPAQLGPGAQALASGRSLGPRTDSAPMQLCELGQADFPVGALPPQLFRICWCLLDVLCRVGNIAEKWLGK